MRLTKYLTIGIDSLRENKGLFNFCFSAGPFKDKINPQQPAA
jgi:hypothetical protein